MCKGKKQILFPSTVFSNLSRCNTMSMATHRSKEVKPVLWQPISDKHAEVVNGGWGYAWCPRTKKYVYCADY